MALKTYGRARLDGAEWVVQATPHVMMRLKRIFPRVRTHTDGAIVVRDTPELARDLEWVLSRWPLDVDEISARKLADRAALHRETETAIERILAGAQPILQGAREPARPGRPYQLQAADLALATGRLLLADDVGLGKSMSGLLLLRDAETLPALVVTLTHLPRQWMSELEKTYPDMLGHVLGNGDVYDPESRLGERPDVIVTSYSKLAKWQHHLAGAVRTVIFDEVQELRRADSERYRAAVHIAGKAAYRVGLTATPVYNYAGEIHNVLSVLAPDALGTRDEFLREWSGTITGFSGNISVKHADALGTWLRDQGLMLRRSRKDVGREIPEPVLIEQPIPTSHQTLDDAVRDASDLAELILSTDAAATDRWRAAGDLDWRMRHATGVAKARYVADFVRMLLETEDKVVLFGWHRDVYDIWKERLIWFHPRFYTGEETPAQKADAVNAFVNGQCRVLIVSLRAGAGLDGLQEAASVAVFGELDWSPGIHEQCVGRLWRDGQDGTVVAYYLVSDGGTDPLMTEVLGLKRREADALRGDKQLINAGASSTDRVRRLAESVIARGRVSADALRSVRTGGSMR